MKTACKVGLIAMFSCCGAMLIAGGSARADAPACGCYGGYGAYGGYFGPYGVYGSDQDHVPFFMLHPPVYYSHPVARAYGYSPFAYPAGTLTPDVEVGPKEIINPYVPPSNKAKPMAETPSGKTAANDSPAVPQVVINPFVGPALAADAK